MAAIGTEPADQPPTAGMDVPGPRPGLKVALDLSTILEHCKCSICMGIIKNTRAVSACMHRFCKDCIEAWLRTQIENNCPQCRVKFSSKRDCKPDPNFDLLLGALFGDIPAFEAAMLDPSAEVLEAAKSIGQQIAEAQAALLRRPSPPPVLLPTSREQRASARQQDAAAVALRGRQQQEQQQPQPEGQQQNPQQPFPSKQHQQHQPQLHAPQDGDAVVHVSVARPAVIISQPAGAAAAAPPVQPGAKRPFVPAAPGGNGAGEPVVVKRPKVNGHGEGPEDPTGLQYRGVRFQGDNWQARTKRSGRELSLGLYNTAEEAGMAYDLDRLQQQGGKAQRLNFPLLRQHYKQILADLADLHTPDGLLDFLAVAVQAALKASRAVPGATAPENTGPAAASALNPRRTMAPAVHATAAAAMTAARQTTSANDAHHVEPQLQTHAHMPTRPAAAAGVTAAVAAAAAVEAADITDSELEEELAAAAEAAEAAEVEAARHLLSLEEQHAVARRQAERLAAERPLAAGLGMGVAFVQLEAGSGPAWRMTCLACPAAATMSQLAEAVAVGLSQQYALRPGQLRIGLAVANDMDAGADFDTLCYEEGATGNLLLRAHVTVSDLLGSLENLMEDLCLEYHTLEEEAPEVPGSSDGAGDVDAGGDGAVAATAAGALVAAP